jgi:hypothetical protein
MNTGQNLGGGGVWGGGGIALSSENRTESKNTLYNHSSLFVVSYFAVSLIHGVATKIKIKFPKLPRILQKLLKASCRSGAGDHATPV